MRTASSEYSETCRRLLYPDGPFTTACSGERDPKALFMLVLPHFLPKKVGWPEENRYFCRRNFY